MGTTKKLSRRVRIWATCGPRCVHAHGETDPCCSPTHTPPFSHLKPTYPTLIKIYLRTPRVRGSPPTPGDFPARGARSLVERSQRIERLKPTKSIIPIPFPSLLRLLPLTALTLT